MKTRITELLGIEHPIIQGGMAWVAEYNLAAAVSNAGGLGLIGAASAPPEIVREQIIKCRELTDKPFGVNVMLLNPNAEEVAKITDAKENLKKALEAGTTEEIKAKIDALTEEYHVISTKLYEEAAKNQQAAQGAAGPENGGFNPGSGEAQSAPKDDNVVDADFEVVD